MDNLRVDAIDLLKIDVEGAELVSAFWEVPWPRLPLFKMSGTGRT